MEDSRKDDCGDPWYLKPSKQPWKKERRSDPNQE